jgi:hypothetical protein
MKRIVSLLFFALVLNSCDDGDLTVGTIDFSTVSTQSCSTTNVIYKLNAQEALILQIPSTAFVNIPTADITKPTSITIDNSTYRVIYRSYSGTVSMDNICSAIPPSTPTVTDQWTAIAGAGTIEIITTAITQAGTLAGSTKITGYNHNITFKNITFSRTSGTQVYETFAFGDHITTVDTLPFGFNKTLNQCPSSKQIYNYTSSEALTLDIDPTLIQNSETPLDQPRKGILSQTTNKLIYRLYNGLITPAYFCNATLPQTPTFNQEWVGVNGVTAISGQVEVTTVTNGITGFKHTIVLKNVTLTNGTSSFKLGDSFIYGDLLTTK